MSRLTPGPTQLPIQWVPGIKWLGCGGDDVPSLVSRLRMIGTIPHLPLYTFMACAFYYLTSVLILFLHISQHLLQCHVFRLLCLVSQRMLMHLISSSLIA